MTFYCRLHSEWEGADLGKIHDHINNAHPELLSEIKDDVAPITEYRRRLSKLVREAFFEIQGPSRLGDRQWINSYHGRPPKIGNLMGNNEMEK